MVETDETSGGEVTTVEVSEPEPAPDDSSGLSLDSLPLGKAVAYLAGGLLVYSGLTTVGSNALGGALTLILGVLALPVVRAQLSPSRRVFISRWVKLVTVVLAILVGDVLLGTDLLPAAVRESVRATLF